MRRRYAIIVSLGAGVCLRNRPHLSVYVVAQRFEMKTSRYLDEITAVLKNGNMPYGTVNKFFGEEFN